MAHHPLKNWSKGRLRLALSVVFITLALPTGVLLAYAYSQLKWEAFHQHRVLAEELVKRIDSQLEDIIGKENARPFTDYAFLNVTGTAQSNLLHRSPLSAFPISGEIKGTIGYFQIDPEGRFSTPIYPNENGNGLQTLGLSNQELARRKKVHDELFAVLSGNNLIPPKSKQDKASRLAGLKLKEEGTSSLSSSLSNEGAASFSGQSRDALAPSPPSSQAPSSLASAEAKNDAYVPSDVFEKLAKETTASKQLSKKKMKKSLGRLDELKLSKQYQQKALPAPRKKGRVADVTKETKDYLPQKQRSLRKEQSQLPFRQTQKLIDEKAASKTASNSTISISMFESEIDAMDFSVLDSGHFILFRKVWKNGQRLIQGVLFEPNAFIDDIIRPSFYDTVLSQSSDLTVAYGDNILTLLPHIDKRDYWSKPSQVEGFLLLDRRLAEPFSGINLVFSANQLPPGPGVSVLNWLALVLLLVLCSGFWFLYRVGVKQLNLAQQQQDFISAVSHELKTPLTSIRMYGEMLMQGWMNEEKRQQYYAFIYDESERLTRLINNILQMARMTRNELHLELKPISAARLMDTLRSKISSQIERAGFEFALTVEEQAKELVAEVDVDYFVQIIINLVDNAIKFSAKAENKRIEVACRRVENNRMQWSVRDFGPGIPKGQMRKIFQLFYRSENEMTRETLGTGIGLALVSELAQAMNGGIDVVNMQPGAEFRVTF